MSVHIIQLFLYICKKIQEPMRRLTSLLLLMICITTTAATIDRKYIDLSGTWQFALDPEGTVTPTHLLTDSISLPGTTDTNRKVYAIEQKNETTHLSRLFSYKGKAWYSRTVEIPASWKGSPVFLMLERSKPSKIYVDGRLAGSSNDISTPQIRAVVLLSCKSRTRHNEDTFST